LDRLRHCLSSHVRQALDELPDTLDKTYERTLRDIDEENWAYARRLFQCILVARRPLRVKELAEFFAFKSETGGGLTFQMDRRPKNPKDKVLSTCSSLVAVTNVDGSEVMEFSHYSVQEYLTSSRITEGRVSRYYISLEPAHLFLTQACLCFLLQLNKHVTKTSIEKLPLARYAGQHWADHAEFGNVLLDAEHLIKRLFNPKNHHFAIWVWIYDPIRNEPMQPERPPLPNLAPLHYAAYYGFHRVAEWLITSCPQGIDLSRRYSSTPLHLASQKGRFSVAQVLLKHHGHAEVNALNDSDTTALHVASSNGHFKVVRLLVEHGAAVHYGPDCGVTPLHATVLSFLVGEDEKLEVSQVLLEYGADPKSRTLLGTDSLYLALMKDYKRLVQLLLKHGADPNTRGVDGQTSLHIACASGDLNVAEGLLELGVDVNSRDKSGQIPLHKALLSNDAKTVKLLLKHGAKLT
jgi:ankyrin repeat protein